jgi:hypothetical protein
MFLTNSMKYFNPKAFLCLLILILASTAINAQKKHFIYVQSENKEPFYVMINNKNYSSSLSGYLIIPRLKNGKYFFIAGFPKDKYPEQKFTYVVNDKDAGFVLKQFGNNGWGLFNVVDFSNLMANDTNWEQDKKQNDTIQLEDTYSVNTNIKPQIQVSSEANNAEQKTTLVKTNTINKEEIDISATTTKKDTPNSSEKKATEAATFSNNQTKINNTNADNADQTPITSSPKRIVRVYQKNSINGVDEMYLDYTSNPADTIIVFIPLNAETDNNPNINLPQNKIQPNSKSQANVNQYNTSCVYLATESDYLKTRKLMSAETSDDKMIKTAKSTFSNKCYYVEQIQKLGLLFLSEQSRLKFFKAAYSNIYDRYNYSSLEMQFTLSSLINQFRQSQ